MQVIIGRKIYYEKNTGVIIYDTGERCGENIKDSTIDEDFAYAIELKGKNRENIGVIKLEAGQYNAEFAEAVSYGVNTETLELEFGYIINNIQFDFQKPYIQQIKELEEQNALIMLELAQMKGGAINVV